MKRVCLIALLTSPQWVSAAEILPQESSNSSITEMDVVRAENKTLKARVTELSIILQANQAIHERELLEQQENDMKRLFNEAKVKTKETK